MRALIVVAMLVAPAAASHGNPYPETAEEKVEDMDVVAADAAPHLQGSVGFELGTFHTGPVYNFAYGFALDAGVQLDKLAILGQYAFLGLASPEPTGATTTTYNTVDLTSAAGDSGSGTPTGFVQRFGAAARYSVAKATTAQHGLGLRFDTWVEAGIGEQLLRWSGGGYLHRPDVELAVGLQFDLRGLHHHGGWFMGMRVTLASPPRMEGPTPAPTCAGPCDGPTGPIGIDRSILFVTAVDFGG